MLKVNTLVCSFRARVISHYVILQRYIKCFLMAGNDDDLRYVQQVVRTPSSLAPVVMKPLQRDEGVDEGADGGVKVAPLLLLE